MCVVCVCVCVCVVRTWVIHTGHANSAMQGSKYRVPHLRPAGTLFSTQVALYVYLHFAQVSAAGERSLHCIRKEFARIARACVRKHLAYALMHKIDD